MRPETVPVETAKYPGTLMAIDGNTAAVLVEIQASEAAGAYPISPSSQMGEGFAEAQAAGRLNAFGRPLIFIEPEGEHAAAAVTAGMSMSGLRAANFSSGQGIAYSHESLYAAAGKRLPYVLNVACRAMTKQSLNVHAGHDDFHCMDDTGFIQLMAKNAQQMADLNLIVRRTAELSLTPGSVGMDGWLTSHVLETVRVPEEGLVREFLGAPDDEIPCPTPAQRLLYGPTRRRVPKGWDVDNPAQMGVVQNQDSYAQGVAAQRPFFFDHIEALGKQAMEEYGALTGRHYDFIHEYRCDDADYVIVGLGSMTENAEAVADYLRDQRGIKVGVLQVVWFRPFPGGRIARALKGRRGVAVLERTDQPLAGDLPLIREVRAALAKAQENGQAIAGGGPDKAVPHAGFPAIHGADEMPRCYSGCYGLGSRDLQPSQLIGAVENMLPDGARKPFFYLGIEFVQDAPPSEARARYQAQLLEHYPRIGELQVEGSENPNLMPEGAISVRFHSIGGWGAVTTGKNLSGTLFDLLGVHLKCNPKYGGEKKGTPTTYYGAFAKERIRTNCELRWVDVVLSPDPNVFAHTDALSGLNEGGAIVIQSSGETPAEVWKQFPKAAREAIAKRNLKVWYVDAFKIAREEATNPDLELRMQGTVFQGAFFRVTTIMEQFGLDEQKLFQSIAGVLEAKFGSKGKRVVDDNVRVVRRGYDEVCELDWRTVEAPLPAAREVRVPIAVSAGSPETQMPLTQTDRFYEQVGRWYTEGHAEEGLADPFVALSFTPAVTGTFRDMTQIRFEYPQWIAENCTGCAKCWTQCPDSAIPGLVVKEADLLREAATRLGNGARSALAGRVEAVATRLHALIAGASGKVTVADLAKQAVAEEAASLSGDAQGKLAAEAAGVHAVFSDFEVARTKPFFDAPEKKGPGGVLLAVTVNPETCKGCMECVQVCDDDALRPTPQDDAAVARLRRGWEIWRALPDTDPAYINISALEEASGVLSSLLLSKKNYFATAGGDGACMGCGEKTPIHLFCAVAEALMQPRVRAQVERCEALLKRVDDAIAAGGDPARMERLGKARAGIHDLVWRYTNGPTGRGRAPMGMVNNTGCTTVWGSTYPYNPYPFPWANHLFQDGPSVAMGVFEGHMREMADGFRAIRIAEKELAGDYDPARDDRFFELFDWRKFTEDEMHLCPPVTVLGGDGAMLDIGFQNLSRALISGRPLKVLVVDTQVYSNTGGQICTSGFIGQVSDMAAFGEHQAGKVEPRKEIGLMGIAHRAVFTAQVSAAHFNHMIKAFIQGFVSKRPALFSAYSTCQPEHGVGDDRSAAQAKLALEGRAFPYFVYDPDAGRHLKDRLSLAGNPAAGSDWPTYNLEFPSGDGKPRKEKVAMTFADFAATEGRFRKHFKKLTGAEAEAPNLVPFADYVALDAAGRAGKEPFIWLAGANGAPPTKLHVGPAIVLSAEERLDFWRLLQDLAGVK